jgi:hypothetical protein
VKTEMSIEKNIRCESWGEWLKMAKQSDHGWIVYDRVEAIKTKRVKVEGVEVEIRYTYVYAVPVDMSFRDKEYESPKPCAVSLSWSDWDNLVNFLIASKPDDMICEIWSNNQSDWLKGKGLSYETVNIRSRVKGKAGYNEYNGFRYSADKLYDVKEYQSPVIHWIKSGSDIQYYKPVNEAYPAPI